MSCTKNNREQLSSLIISSSDAGPHRQSSSEALQVQHSARSYIQNTSWPIRGFARLGKSCEWQRLRTVTTVNGCNNAPIFIFYYEVLRFLSAESTTVVEFLVIIVVLYEHQNRAHIFFIGQKTKLSPW